ncbi:hypothetical protein BRI6_1582 [plant metagenome]|uniref:Uncharacterized protein n=1 Tax=plant metagenome TaxID=1297885 RepID=A0A484S2T6_9ZZZZ
MGRGHLGIRHQAELTSTRSLSAACWPASAGLFFAAGPPQDKKRPLWGAASRRRGVGAWPPWRPGVSYESW